MPPRLQLRGTVTCGERDVVTKICERPRTSSMWYDEALATRLQRSVTAREGTPRPGASPLRNLVTDCVVGCSCAARCPLTGRVVCVRSPPACAASATTRRDDVVSVRPSAGVRRAPATGDTAECPGTTHARASARDDSPSAQPAPSTPEPSMDPAAIVIRARTGTILRRSSAPRPAGSCAGDARAPRSAPVASACTVPDGAGGTISARDASSASTRASSGLTTSRVNAVGMPH